MLSVWQKADTATKRATQKMSKFFTRKIFDKAMEKFKSSEF
jgi:hypothetical protein